MYIPDKLDSVEIPYHRVGKKTVELCSHNRIDSVHYHPEVQIWYTLSGSYKQSVNGVDYLLPHGSMLFVPPFAKHMLNTLDFPEKQLICCSFFLDDYNKVVAERENEVPLLSFNDFGIYINSKPHAHVVLFEEDARDSADAFFLDLLNQCNNVASDTEILRSLKNPLSLLPRSDGEEIKPNKLCTYLEKYRAVCRAVEYVYEHYSDDACIDDACKIAAMSKTVFFKTFQMITGITFLNYVNSFRMRKVKQYLISTDLTLDAIAYDCGFTHKSHLIHTFKKRYGCSPSEYKQFARPWYEKYGPETQKRKCENYI